MSQIVLPAGAKIRESVRLITWMPHGVLDARLAREAFRFIEAHEQSEAVPFHRFADLSELSEIRLSLVELEELAQWRAANYRGETVKSAILALNPLAFGIAQMYERLMRRSPIEVRVFCRITSASHWLRAPIEMLISTQ